MRWPFIDGSRGGGGGFGAAPAELHELLRGRQLGGGEEEIGQRRQQEATGSGKGFHRVPLRSPLDSLWWWCCGSVCYISRGIQRPERNRLRQRGVVWGLRRLRDPVDGRDDGNSRCNRHLCPHKSRIGINVSYGRSAEMRVRSRV